MPLPAASDDDLLRRAQDGDLDAFDVFVRRYEVRLNPVVARLLDDPRDVEEVLQDTFVAAWRALPGFRGDSSVLTWTYRIAVNAAISKTRRRSHLIAPLDDSSGVAAASTPHAEAETAELRRQLVLALNELTPEARHAVVLRDVAGLSNAEVAEVVGSSLAATKTRIHRARLELARRLTELSER